VNYLRCNFGLLLWSVLSGVVAAEEWPKDLESFRGSYCFGCHDGKSTEAGLDLRSLSRDLTDAGRLEYWTLIHDRIRAAEMPPNDVDQPSNVAREKAVLVNAFRAVWGDQLRTFVLSAQSDTEKTWS
jgi:hypothetical protein